MRVGGQGAIPDRFDHLAANFMISAVDTFLVITANPAVPSRDLRELGAFLRSNKTLQYNYGSTGPGSVMHVVGETFKRDAKVDG